MKKHIQLFAILAFIAFPLFTFAQPQPPNNNGAPTAGNEVGSGGGAAPIGGGILMLLGMAAGYAGRSIYDAKKKLAE